MSETKQGKDGLTRRRAESQTAMRERLQGYGLLQQIKKTIDSEISKDDLAAEQFKTQTRLKLLNKILPDLSSTTIENGDEGPLQIVIKAYEISPTK